MEIQSPKEYSLGYLDKNLLTSPKSKDPLTINSAFSVIEGGVNSLYLTLTNDRERWDVKISLSQKGDRQRWLRSQREEKLREIC